MYNNSNKSNLKQKLMTNQSQVHRIRYKLDQTHNKLPEIPFLGIISKIETKKQLLLTMS